MGQERERQTSKKAKLTRGFTVVVFAATASACEQKTPTEQDTLSPTEPIVTQPVEIPTLTFEPEPTATEAVDATPEAEFGEVGFIPGVFPGAGGENWRFTDVLTVSTGGTVDTSIVKQEGFTPLAEEEAVVAKLAEGENGSSFFLVPRLDQVQYIKPDESIGTATFNPDLSSGLVHVYSDGNQVIYRQPSVMADYGDGTVPVLGREDATGDVWVLYLSDSGQILRRAPVFFGPDSQVEVVDGKVMVEGKQMVVSETSGEWERPIEIKTYIVERQVPVTISDETGTELALNEEYGDEIANAIFEFFLDALAAGQPGGTLGRNGDEAWKIAQSQETPGWVTIKFPYTKKHQERLRTFDLIQLRSQRINLNEGLSIRVIDPKTIVNPDSRSGSIIWDSNLQWTGFYFKVKEGGRMQISLVPKEDNLDGGADAALRASFELLALLKERPKGEEWNKTGQLIVGIAFRRGFNPSRLGLQWTDNRYPPLFLAYDKYIEISKEYYPDSYDYYD